MAKRRDTPHWRQQRMQALEDALLDLLFEPSVFEPRNTYYRYERGSRIPSIPAVERAKKRRFRPENCKVIWKNDGEIFYLKHTRHAMAGDLRVIKRDELA